LRTGRSRIERVKGKEQLHNLVSYKGVGRRRSLRGGGGAKSEMSSNAREKKSHIESDLGGQKCGSCSEDENQKGKKIFKGVMDRDDHAGFGKRGKRCVSDGPGPLEAKSLFLLVG